MSNANTWNSLPKTLNDAQTISEYIAAQLATHNADDSAHGQSDEAIYNHRIATILDHLDESVKNSKIIGEHRIFTAIVGTSAEDDYDDIQDAIDYVDGLGGGTVYVRRGTYTISSNITVPSNIHLLGEGPELTIIDFNSTAYQIILGDNVAQRENMSVEKMQIANRIPTTDSGAIKIYSSKKVQIKNCKFTNNIRASAAACADIEVQGNNFYCEQIEISENQFIDSVAGVKIWGGKDVEIFNNYSEGSNQHAFYPVECENIWLFDNVINNCAGAAIFDDSESSDFKIDNNTIYRPGTYGIYLSSTLSFTITNNHIIGPSANYDGIYISYNDEGSTIIGNIVLACHRDGIRIDGADKLAIIGNACRANTGKGIYIMANSDRNIVVGNNLYTNTGANYTDSGTNTQAANNVIA